MTPTEVIKRYAINPDKFDDLVNDALERYKPSGRGRNELVKGLLVNEMIRCKEEGVMSKTLMLHFCTLAEAYLTNPEFRQLTVKWCDDIDAIADVLKKHAVYSLIRMWERTDEPNQITAFAYFTGIVHNAFIQMVHKENAKQLTEHDAYEQARKVL